jgi:spore photoproduct lyase
MKIIKQKTKTLLTKDNGRSSDAISPNFIYGCLGGCMKTYCYVGRYNHDRVYINENTSEILVSILKWVNKQPWPKSPNQCDETYYTVDIGCNTDVPLHSKHYDWQVVFDLFNAHSKLKFTFATKYPTKFDVDKYWIDPKNRIRVSLMPQKYADVLEPNTDSIADRIAMIPKLQEKMEVHINFSPIIYHEGWLDEYRELFQQIKDAGIDVKCECIFLTHNINQQQRNSEEVEALLWKPEIQETKFSQHSSSENVRYNWQLKKKLEEDFVSLYSEFFDPKNIRYIF